MTIAKQYRLKADIFTNETSKLFRRDLTQTFEAGDLRFTSQLLQ